MKLVVPILLALSLICGCARTATETTVAADGSWTRTVKLIIPKEAPMGDKPPTFEESFVVPSGAGWNVTRTTDKENQILTAVRSMKLGETLSKDIQIKDKTTIVCTNEVKVTQIAPGRYEYLETVKYVGAKKPDAEKPKASLVAELKAVLPPDTSTQKLEKIAGDCFIGAWRVIFGPSEPLLSALLFSPDLAERRIQAKMGRTFEKVLAQELGDKMDKDARLKAIRALMAKMDSEDFIGPEKDKQKESEGDNSQLVSMFCSVKLPGTIVEADGEVDEVTGEVYWAFYPESAQVGDVVLRAVCEVK